MKGKTKPQKTTSIQKADKFAHDLMHSYAEDVIDQGDPQKQKKDTLLPSEMLMLSDIEELKKSTRDKRGSSVLPETLSGRELVPSKPIEDTEMYGFILNRKSNSD